MLKVNVFLTRREDLTHEGFTSYWTNVHTPKLLAPEAPKEALRYVQLHPVALPEGVPAAPYDGIAEIWFADIDAAMRMIGSEYWNTTIAEDEENFLDRSKTVVLFSEEKEPAAAA